MPPAGRLSTSDSLATHDVWKKTVGHDPYAGEDEGGGDVGIPEGGEINSSAKGLFRLAQLTGNSSTLAPGACKRCGQVGHLYFQCRNNMRLKKPDPNQQFVAEDDDDDEEEEDAFPTSEEDDSDDSDSDSDSDDDSDEESSSSDKKKKKRKRKKDKKKKDKKKKKKDKKKDKKKKRKK
eukprot:TRINITY_DN2210_c3_g1_i1.p1 TRINITY_DN2210_c3_g1~~TRINITY_DN2210_c3_g1_i1.p1  ORF type:complete len:178 (+),score=65.81 TRINITY_DN2210_c3_g1_i1:78-611(+)